MTRPEFSYTRDLTFSGWIRKNLPDSALGFMVSDLDFILQNYKTKKLMLLEIKTHNSDCKYWQKSLLKRLDKWLIKGIEQDWQYLGFNIIQFENTCFIDGKCFFNYKEINEQDLKNKLSF